MNNLKTLVLAVAALVFPVAANAEVAYTTKTAHLRAGPARDYPVVVILRNGLAVDVQGCMQDYSWCDVIAGKYRGWIYAGNIVYFYQGANVPVIDYGAAIGIGVATFIIGSSWHDHHINRPRYRQMPQWSHRPPRASAHPRPQRAGAPPRSMQRSAPSPQPAPRANVHPRQPQVGTRLGGERRPAPDYHTDQRPPRANVNPPAHRQAQPRREQGPTPDPSRRSRPRQ